MIVILKKRSAWNFAILDDILDDQGTFVRLKPNVQKGISTW